MDQVTPPQSGGRRALGVFAHRSFTTIWLAHFAVLTCIAMYDTASGWIILKLGPDPRSVSMLGAATNMPVFLVTLLAGAVADVVDPRRSLIAVSGLVAVLLAAFSVLMALDVADTRVLLATTFLLSSALSFGAPAWLAIVPQLVGPDELPGAMAVNSVAYNISRAAGPALGGVVIARFGMTAPFLLLVGVNIVMVAALMSWRPPPAVDIGLPAERLSSAIRAGLRHAVNNRPFRTALVRALAIFPCAAAYWGLLPLIAARVHGGAGFFGVLISAISVGTILGSLVQRLLRWRMNNDERVALGSFATVGALVGFAFAHDMGSVISASLLAGAGWVLALSSLYAAAESTLASWVRARGLSVFLTVVFGALALGSAFWGFAARYESVSVALLAAAACGLAGVPLTWRWRLDVATSHDLTPSRHWRMPETAYEIENERGPVLVKIGYRIDPERRTEFLRAMDELSFERRGDGAFGWGIFEDATENGRYEETYLIGTWLELLHLRERVTRSDLLLEEEIRHMLKESPQIEFLVNAEARKKLFRKPERAAGA